jgi:hypothetical protein
MIACVWVILNVLVSVRSDQFRHYSGAYRHDGDKSGLDGGYRHDDDEFGLELSSCSRGGATIGAD